MVLVYLTTILRELNLEQDRAAGIMKKIGLLGGMSWESTAVYYQQLNRISRDRLGGLHSANLLLWSFDFAEIEKYQSDGDWQGVTQLMVNAAQTLERGGAQCLLICTNTMHKMAPEVQASIDIPLLHIADASAPSITAAGVASPLLLATRYTMEQDFYKGYLHQQHGIKAVIPDKDNRDLVHDIIYNELCCGVVLPESKRKYLDVIEQSVADGVIFGCTEVGLLLSPSDVSLPVFDTTLLHAEAAIDFALQNS